MNSRITGIAIFTLSMISASAQADAISELEAVYRTQGVSQFSASSGEALWKNDFVDSKSAETRNCGSCHGADLARAGKHNTTGKTIEPMARSVNPERYSDTRKIEKWFLRNCKWTLGRECSAQEKGDVLAYLKSL
ncbi:MAG: DUF1924 domain-containing protein [Gammaproteobacteria bacterium]|nr:DUF1924 domain-containing protein [Gammaproteobacteria bacterium]MBL6998350.1 DUF1924 domain-containing protein [Gammaproteobacteria bacterium]